MAVLAGLIFTTSAGAAPLHFVGAAYDIDSGKLLYREVHDVTIENGRAVRGSTVYVDAGGNQIARKTADYQPDPYVPVFAFEIPGLKYEEAITGNGDAVVMTRKTGGKLREARVAKKTPMAADAGLLNLIADQFPTLLEGKSLKLTIAVVARLDRFTVRLRRIDDIQFAGRPAVRFQLEHDSPLRLLLNPLVLTYDPETRRLLEYRGQSNIRDPKTGNPYEVRIDFSGPS
jgi:hypothetical protein